jgi:CRP/FNR family transcriptional regulator, cyclic AMP receptor protein
MVQNAPTPEPAPNCTCEELAGPGITLARECLAHVWVFQNLKPGEVQALLSSAWRTKYREGEPIFHQGAQAQAMFLVKAGRLKLTKATEDGRELILDIRKAGDVVGETLLADESIYPVSCYCLEDTLVCGFTRARFEALVSEYPNIGLQVIRNLSNRVSRLQTRVDSMSEGRLEERIYRVLSMVAQEHGRPSDQGVLIHFPLTHEELAFLTGSHRVSVTRVMKGLAASGRVIRKGRYLVLPDLPAAPA